MNSACVFVLGLALFCGWAEAFDGYNDHSEPHYGFPGTSICNSCHCVKTILRPQVVERIPYTCTSCIQAPYFTIPFYPLASVDATPATGITQNRPYFNDYNGYGNDLIHYKGEHLRPNGFN